MAELARHLGELIAAEGKSHRRVNIISETSRGQGDISSKKIILTEEPFKRNRLCDVTVTLCFLRWCNLLPCECCYSILSSGRPLVEYIVSYREPSFTCVSLRHYKTYADEDPYVPSMRTKVTHRYLSPKTLALIEEITIYIFGWCNKSYLPRPPAVDHNLRWWDPKVYPSPRHLEC